MIYTQITNSHQFAEAFRRFGRGEQFTSSGFSVLFKYLEESEQDIELDVIALCCDYMESSVEELINEHEIDVEGLNLEEDYDDIKYLVEEYLQERTTVIGTTSTTTVYAAF